MSRQQRKRDDEFLLAALEEASGDKPYLGDLSVVEQIIKESILALLQAKDPDDMLERFKEQVESFPRIFLGKDERYRAASAWNLEGHIDAFIKSEHSHIIGGTASITLKEFARFILRRAVETLANRANLEREDMLGLMASDILMAAETLVGIRQSD